MTRLKQWALDVGLWEAPSVDQWSWWKFRPKFWVTPTNLFNRTVAEALLTFLLSYHRDVQDSYAQGYADGVTMARDQAELDEGRPTLTKYQH